MKMLDKHPEPKTFCDSCWWCDEIDNSRFGVVLYCHYHEVAYEDYEVCDDYENAARIAMRWRL